MSVGTGSINRAARTGKKATASTAEKTTEVTVKAEEAKNDAAATAKTVETKKAAPKKRASEKETTPTEKKQKPELTVYADETVFVVANECCQLTQELPIHLL